MNLENTNNDSYYSYFHKSNLFLFSDFFNKINTFLINNINKYDYLYMINPLNIFNMEQLVLNTLYINNKNNQKYKIIIINNNNIDIYYSKCNKLLKNYDNINYIFSLNDYDKSCDVVIINYNLLSLLIYNNLFDINDKYIFILNFELPFFFNDQLIYISDFLKINNVNYKTFFYGNYINNNYKLFLKNNNILINNFFDYNKYNNLYFFCYYKLNDFKTKMNYILNNFSISNCIIYVNNDNYNKIINYFIFNEIEYKYLYEDDDIFFLNNSPKFYIVNNLFCLTKKIYYFDNCFLYQDINCLNKLKEIIFHIDKTKKNIFFNNNNNQINIEKTYNIKTINI